jgi:hypothetical protein
MIMSLAFVYYVSERASRNGEREGQIDSFVDAVWVLAMTSISTGYGDLYPATLPGRICAGIASILGKGLLASLVVALYTSLTLDQD